MIYFIQCMHQARRIKYAYIHKSFVIGTIFIRNDFKHIIYLTLKNYHIFKVTVTQLLKWAE